VDPNPMPWRAIEATSVVADAAAPVDGSPRRPSRLAMAATGLAGVIVAATFLVAWGSGSGGAVEVEGGGAITDASTADPDRSPIVSSAGVNADAPAELVIEIVGAVTRPGVYHLPAGSRVGDLVDAAGGYGPRVDAERTSRVLNLAARLSDGDQVRVPSRDDPPPGDPTPGNQPPGGTPDAGTTTIVDLNHATSAELDALPGIGPATAAKIIAAREATPFATVDDLQTRKLVGAKTFDGLRELVTVR
jgi:competence protein ComEA